jgi:hypothetical protein
MNSALSHNIASAISRVAPAFKISGDEVSTRLLAVLFPVPTVTIPTAPAPPPAAAPATPPKPKPAPPAPVPPAPVKPKVPVLNLVALNPTLQKKLVGLYDEANGGGHDDAYADAAESFLAHVNRMPAKEFAAKPALDHLREFLKPQRSNAAAAPAAAPPPPKVAAPPPKPAEVEVDENCVAVMYKGREYWVGEDSKRVYEETSEGVHELRGMLGLAEFDAMVMPVDEV